MHNGAPVVTVSCRRNGSSIWSDRREPPFSFEVLIAELSSCFLRSAAGIDTEPEFENSVAHRQCWIKRLRDDDALIVKAASAAQKAAEWVHETSRQSQGH